MNSLDQLKQFTRVVADTGDFKSILQYKPVDATTNPSLILASAQDPQYRHLIDEAVQWAGKMNGTPAAKLNACMDRLAVNFGSEILSIVPGRVSTEVDARLSFDTMATVEKARQIISLYESRGFDRSRILIKIASTWEGIKAAEIIEKEQIHTNLTLLFSPYQAIACAEGGIQLISPFVGRILDWHKANRKVDHIDPAEDPGVESVRKIYHYFKHFGYKTEVMGASFRNSGEILELAGCDLLTIAPSLLSELEKSEITVTRKLSEEWSKNSPVERIGVDEKQFRWGMNEDAMATEKLAEGIRKFSADLIKLEQIIMRELS